MAGKKRKSKTSAAAPPSKRPLTIRVRSTPAPGAPLSPTAQPDSTTPEGPPPPGGDDQGHNCSQSSDEIGVATVNKCGRIVGRYADGWDDLTEIILAGIASLAPDADSVFKTERTLARERAFERLSRACPGILKFITSIVEEDEPDSEQYGLVAAELDKGRRAARTEDRAMFEEELASWLGNGFILPVYKHERGIQHEGCFELLCPPEEDWRKAEVRARYLAEGLWHEALPSYMWDKDKFDPNDFWEGFCRSEIIFKALKAMLISRSEARGRNRTTRPGIAANYGTEYIEVSTIAYVVNVIQFTLHPQAVYTGGPGQIGEGMSPELRKDCARDWPYRLFYYQVLDMLENVMEPDDRNSLLDYYNKRLFPTDNGETLASAPNPNSTRAKMHAQAEERRLQREAERAQQ